MAEELAARLGRLSLQAGADAEVVASPVAFKPSDLAGLDDVLGTLREVRTSNHVDRIPVVPAAWVVKNDSTGSN